MIFEWEETNCQWDRVSLRGRGAQCALLGSIVRQATRGEVDSFNLLYNVGWHTQKELVRSMSAYTEIARYGSNSPLMPDLRGYEAVALKRNTHTTLPQRLDLPAPQTRLATAHLPYPNTSIPTN
jgi:hypothetical protein